ncbi:MAG TPA: hypothetical protein VLD85_14370 [Anaeromyxobacteraceae bacterium]|nr:hypothetical protein [Anaeromyxobacteraceae bacterium]
MRALLAAVSLLPALAASAPPAGRPAERITLVACAPGYPGSTAEAQPSMDALAAALARTAGWKPGALAAVYEPTEKEGLERLARADAAVALVPLPFFLEHAGKLRLTARLQVEQPGGLTEVWSLVARKGRVASPAALAGFTVASIAGYAPGFVRGAPGAWGRIPEGVRVAETSQVLSALRRAAAGEDVAVLLDGAQGAALPTLPFAADLEVVARSAPLPAALVTTVGSRLPAARWRQLEQAFAAVPSDPEGAAALAGVRMVRFAPVDAAALATARRLAAGPSR